MDVLYKALYTVIPVPEFESMLKPTQTRNASRILYSVNRKDEPRNPLSVYLDATLSIMVQVFINYGPPESKTKTLAKPVVISCVEDAAVFVGDVERIFKVYGELESIKTVFAGSEGFFDGYDNDFDNNFEDCFRLLKARGGMDKIVVILNK